MAKRALVPRGSSPLPVSYVEAKSAIAECLRVDECKGWADKAAAFRAYAKMKKDKSLERTAQRIQLRAYQRAGALLDEMDAKKSGRPKKVGPSRARLSERAQSAKDAGLSEKEAKTALRLAAVPANLFEAGVEQEDPATVTELAEVGTKKKPVPLVDIQGRDPKEFNDALHLQAGIARLAETVRSSPVDTFLRGCLPEDTKDVIQSATELRAWLDHMLKEIA